MRYLAFLLALPLCAQPTNLNVVAKTQTQLALHYTAPDTNPCTIEASESNTYLPLVNDINSTLYTNANSDNARYPTLQSGITRQFPIGSRTYERALDSRIYSRALASGTTIFIRVTCTGGSATVSATTYAHPFGSTYVDAPQTSPDFPGRLVLPTTYDSARGARIIDPITGASVYIVSRPGDDSQAIGTASFGAVVSSTNWVNPNNILVNDAMYATYSGTSCGTTCDWISVSWTGTLNASIGGLDGFQTHLTGFGSDATAVNRTVQYREVPKGGSCDDTTLDTFEITLPQSTEASVAFFPPLGNVGRNPTAYAQTSITDLNTAGGMQWCFRKKTSTGNLSLDFAQFDEYQSQAVSTGSGGNPTLTSPVAYSSGCFLSYLAGSGGAAAALYSTCTPIGSPPTIAYLGDFESPYGGGQCTILAFDFVDGNTMYCGPSSQSKIFKLVYTGNHLNKSNPYNVNADITQTEFTSGTSITALAKAFVAANISHYPFAFDDTSFSCAFDAINHGGAGGDLEFVCRHGQNGIGWYGIYRISTTSVVAVGQPSWTATYSPWCGYHSFEDIGQQPVFVWTSHFLDQSDPDYNSTKFTLAAAVTSTSQTSFILSGQPTLRNLKVGDTLSMPPIASGEYVIVTNIASFPTITVTRGAGGSTPTTYSNGATGVGFCASNPSGLNYTIGSGTQVWDYINNPFGDNASFSWNNNVGPHYTARINHEIGDNFWAKSASGTNLLATVMNPNFNNSYLPDMTFAGVGPISDCCTYEFHPTWMNILGGTFPTTTSLDSRPLEGGNLLSVQTPGCDPTMLYPAANGCAMQRVSGTSNVYKYTLAGSVATIDPRIVPVFGVTSGFVLKNISGPSSLITDATTYTDCVALLANECRSGSSPGDLFLSAPGINTYYCTGGTGAGANNDGCLSDRPAAAGIFEVDTSANGLNQNKIRNLVQINTHAPSLRYSTGDSAKHVSDGTAALFNLFTPTNQQAALVVTPSILSDGVDRTTFIPHTLTIDPTAVAGTAFVAVKYGFTPALQASPNRAEVTYAVTATVNTSTPFLWASEWSPSSNRVACSTLCSVTLPGVWGGLLYTSVVYINAGGSVIGTGPICLECAVAGVPPISPTISGNVTISGTAVIQ